MARAPIPESVIILRARIVPSDPDNGDYQAAVRVNGSDGSKDVILFEYYDDEISFTSEELEGLTARQAFDLYTKKDIEYIQSP